MFASDAPAVTSSFIILLFAFLALCFSKDIKHIKAMITTTIEQTIAEYVSAVGAIVRIPNGDVLGATVGLPVGNLVGTFVGVPVGNVVGATVGLPVGNLVGAFVGVPVGNIVGEPVGDVVGTLEQTVFCHVEQGVLTYQPTGQLEHCEHTVF